MKLHKFNHLIIQGGKIKMTHSSKILAVLFLFCLVSAGLEAGDKIKIKLHQPLPNMLGVADMWNLDLDNTSGGDMKIYLTGTASEDKDGLIIEGKSKPFTIKPGRTSYKYSDFSGAEVKYNNGKYKEIILRTGNAPEGSYTICVTAYNESGEVVGLENCIMQTVQQTGSISLISPSDGEEVNPGQPLLFAWALLPKGGPYSLKIVQLADEQSPDVAFRTERPILEKVGIQITSYQYNSADVKLETGKKYAWQVTSGGVESEVYTFIVKSESGQITLISPANSKVLNGGNELTFRWTPLVPKPNGSVKYRLKVWQLMEGQNGTQAMRSNQPIIIKDVDNITEITVANIYTGPCKPPYMCDFIWEVQVLNQGQPIENSNSEASTFKIITKDTSDKGPPLIAIEIKITFGRKKEACKNKGICDVEIKFSWEAFKPEDNTGKGIMTAIDDKTIEIKINKETGLTSAGHEKYFSSGFFDLDEDYIFGNDIKEMLKMKEVVNVKAGRYEVNEKDGFLTMRFSSEGSSPSSAMVAMKMGRPQTIGDCKETGCCHNEIYEYKDGSNLMEREIKMKLSFEGDMLKGEFMSEMPEKGNEFPISEDIVLDKNTSGKLGFESITISPDNYKIEYSSNNLGVLYLKVKEKGNRTK